MLEDKIELGFDSLAEAIRFVEENGYVIHFKIIEKGFHDPLNNFTYLPECICMFKPIKIINKDFLYLLKTIDNKKGLIKDVHKYENPLHDYFLEHLERIQENDDYEF